MKKSGVKYLSSLNQKMAHNNVNQPDPFFVRTAHEKGSGYLRR